MGRRIGCFTAAGFPPLRQYWQEINRHDREVAAQVRAEHKARDQRRPRCRCEAYRWPHRPCGGLCRYPDPPVEKWQPKPGGRPYRKRYAGILRQIARNNGLNPIRDQQAIEALMPQVLAKAKELHRKHPKCKYRNMEITDNEVIPWWTTAGPTM